MKGFGGGMAQLMKQANQMQIKMKKAQEEMALREFEGQAGGGGVKVVVNGDSKLLKLEINPEVISAGDQEMLQDLIIVAVNEAVKTAKETSAKEMEKITGGMGGLPGMF
ncbi:MAG: YbaB/EbfC family nucleoid-associated protein [Bdellovibrionota bacterium]